MGFLNLINPRRSKKDCLIALDIGTEFVKAVIFEIDFQSKKGIIIGVGRQKQDRTHMHAGSVSDIEGAAESCRLAINEAAAMAKVKPSQVIMGIAGELVKGSTTSFIYKRSNPQETIDLPELKNIVQKVQWKAFDQIRSQLSKQTGRPEIEIKLINALITDVRIDTYKVNNPLGFQGKEIFLSIFNVYAPLVHLSALQAIAKDLNLDLLAITAEPYAVARCSSLEAETGAIFIDIGGGTTDIALVSKTGLEETRSLALAGRAFTKRLAQQLGLGHEEAEEVKIKYGQSQLSQFVSEKIRDIFSKDISIWLDGVELALEEFKIKEPLPVSILLCGGGSCLPEVAKILKKKEIQNKWSEKFPFNSFPKIDFVKSKNISGIIDQTGLLDGPQDIMPMALAKLGLDLVTEKENVLSFITRKTVKIMQR